MKVAGSGTICIILASNRFELARISDIESTSVVLATVGYLYGHAPTETEPPENQKSEGKKRTSENELKLSLRITLIASYFAPELDGVCCALTRGSWRTIGGSALVLSRVPHWRVTSACSLESVTLEGQSERVTKIWRRRIAVER